MVGQHPDGVAEQVCRGVTAGEEQDPALRENLLLAPGLHDLRALLPQDGDEVLAWTLATLTDDRKQDTVQSLGRLPRFGSRLWVLAERLAPAKDRGVPDPALG